MALELAPEGIRGKPQAHEWADDLMQSWPALINSIPTAVTDAANAPTVVKNDMYVKNDTYVKNVPNILNPLSGSGWV